MLNQILFVSATPGDLELELDQKPSEQIIRPTGLLDPIVEVRPTEGQIDDLIKEIKLRIKKGERTFVTTTTIKMSEELANYLKDKGLKTAYIHSELKTMERAEVLRKVRAGIYDVVVGINLLREGLDIPEASLMIILEADKEGFLRNRRSLIQTIGRVSRNSDGKAILYADKITKSMQEAIDETSRRRTIQDEYNKKHNITPKTIVKKIEGKFKDDIYKSYDNVIKSTKTNDAKIRELISKLEKEMKDAASKQDFELAAELRDTIIELRGKLV